MQDQEREFVARVMEMATTKVAYAIERNIASILEDIQSQKKFFGDDGRPGSDKIDVTVVMRVERPLPHCARLAVTSVSWATKVRRKDTDFEAGEVDIDALYLPGMDPIMSGQQKAPAAEYQVKNIREANLLAAAKELGKKVYRACQDKANPNWERTVEEWTGSEWRPALCESIEQAKRVLVAATDLGHIAINANGDLTWRSWQYLVGEGYDVCVEEIHEAYSDPEAYRAAGGLEVKIYDDVQAATALGE
jgi:hypothetical protein